MALTKHSSARRWWNRCRERQDQLTRVFGVVEDLDVRYASVLWLLIANPATGVVVLLKVGRIERSDGEHGDRHDKDSGYVD